MLPQCQHNEVLSCKMASCGKYILCCKLLTSTVVSKPRKGHPTQLLHHKIVLMCVQSTVESTLPLRSHKYSLSCWHSASSPLQTPLMQGLV